MRPINRRASPQNLDFDNYRDAFPELQSRLGPYCSYCERRIATQLAVEHIQPKGLPQYEQLKGRWDNFLLACVNCNGTKSDKNVVLSQVYLPDRDNSFFAFIYSKEGDVLPAPNLNAQQLQLAADTLALTGLDKGPNEVLDENGKIVAIDRFNQRKEIWLMAISSKEDLHNNPTIQMRWQITKTAQGSGFFSIWMEVFHDDMEMRRMLIMGFSRNGEFYGFAGTAQDCFDANTQPVSPRPASALANSGKI
jgi:uncharacterized protein (TIGR02646 family)